MLEYQWSVVPLFHTCSAPIQVLEPQIVVLKQNQKHTTDFGHFWAPTPRTKTMARRSGVSEVNRTSGCLGDAKIPELHDPPTREEDVQGLPEQKLARSPPSPPPPGCGGAGPPRCGSFSCPFKPTQPKGCPIKTHRNRSWSCTELLDPSDACEWTVLLQLITPTTCSSKGIARVSQDPSIHCYPWSQT